MSNSKASPLKDYPKTLMEATLRLFNILGVDERVSRKSMSALVLEIISPATDGSPRLKVTLEDTSFIRFFTLDELLSRSVCEFVLSLTNAVITTHPYRLALEDFIQNDWLSSGFERRSWNTFRIYLVTEDLGSRRVLLEGSGGTESPVYGMIYNTVIGG
jgi:hypothetical protein